MAENYTDYAKRGLEYTTPSGEVFLPLFQKVATHRQRKFKSYAFVNVEGNLLQDMGMSSDRFKLRLWFIGNDHHIKAQKFLSALSERGYAKLTLPLDEKDHRVVLPIDIKQENDMVDFINRSVFEVEFRETLGAYSEPDAPLALTAVPGASLSDKIGALKESAKAGFADGLKSFADKIPGASLIKSLSAQVKKGLNFGGEWVNTIQDTFDDVRKIQSTLIKDFQAITTAIDQGADSFLESPLILASQIQSALNIPKFPLFENLIGNYKGFIDGIQEPPRSYGKNSNNQLHIQTIFGVSAVSALAVKTLSSEFQTREAAVDALDEVKEIYEAFATYLESQEAATAGLPLQQRFTVAPDVYTSLYEVIQGVTGGLEQSASNLPQSVEKTVTYPTTTLNIAAEYYPALFASDQDAALKLVEDLSELQGSKIVLLERGDTFKVLI
jgi:hypothetical protein